LKFATPLIGLVFVLTAAGGPELSPQMAVPIHVVSTSSSVHFPDEVVLTLEAESDARISEVRLYYRLGSRTVRVYGYPDFTPSTRVKADFRIKTGGSNYLPSGVDITYNYRIVDEDGNAFETDSFTLEYKDPTFQWKSIEHDGFVVLYHDRPFERVDEVAGDVAERLAEVKDLLGLETSKPQKAVIFNGSREASRSFPVISDRASQDGIYAGFAYGDYDLFVLVGLSLSGMVHEMTHLLIDEAIDSPFAVLPSWLNEGLAMYFEPGSGRRDSTVLRAAERDELLSLRSTGSVPGRPSDVRLFYAQAQSIVDYMMETYGPERMGTTLKAINEGNRIDQAVQVAYGMSLDDLEREWQGQLGGTVSATPAGDPGTLGTTAIIAGSVVIAVVAVIIRWLRRIMGGPVVEDPEL
jgi:hypothetical protein